MRGWFLECFEEGVGGFDVHPVGFLADGDFLWCDSGGDVEFRQKGTHRARLGGVDFADWDEPHFALGAEGEVIGVVFDCEVSGRLGRVE